MQLVSIRLIKRLLIVLLTIALALLWVLLGAEPVFAQTQIIDYSHSSVQTLDPVFQVLFDLGQQLE